MSTKGTIKCIKHPGRNALTYSGHVHHTDGFILLSGWCEECVLNLAETQKSYIQWPFQKVCRKNSDYYNGCDGIWKREYGISDFRHRRLRLHK